jgi:hypothetical protein
LKPLRKTDLAVLAVGLAVATWLVVRVSYGHLPPLHWWLPTPLGVLAVAEALGTRTLRARLAAERAARSAAARSHQPTRPNRPTQPTRQTRPVALVRPVEPMLVARLAVLAQASAYVAAVCGGLWAGVLAYVGPLSSRAQAARGDAVAAVIGVVCAAALVAAALWLESVCRVPPAGPDGEPGARA